MRLSRLRTPSGFLFRRLRAFRYTKASSVFLFSSSIDKPANVHYICVYLYTFIYLYLHIYTYIYSYIPMYTCIYVYIPIYTYVYIHTPIFTYIHLYVPIYRYTNIYRYTYLYIYMSQRHMYISILYIEYISLMCMLYM